MAESGAIVACELTHYYGHHKAVDHINFSIETGQIFGLLGPNGAGKSTTVKMLTTLLPPSSGTARILGYDVCIEPESVRGVVGYVPQLLSADGDLTGYENLLLSAKLYGVTGKEGKARIAEVLEFMGLSEVAKEQVSTYSGGMIRRLEIAQALVHRPQVLFLDEPTVGLDPSARKSVWKHLHEWRSEYKTTILMTTHDMEEADKACDIVAFMHLGKIVAMDTPDELKAALGHKKTLDDAFIHYTGSTITETGDFSNAKQMRRALSRRT